VVAFDHGDGFHVMFGYNADLFRGERIARMKEHFAQLLEAALRAPDTRASHLPVLSAEERRRLLEEWNPRAEYPEERCLHERFEDQARRTPERIALVSGDTRLTYAQLDRRANQLAHRLARMGVAPDDRVGLLLDRSAELVVAILGTLKAGAGYVPMDPHAPPERIALMLGDSAPTAVVTESASVGKLPAPLGARALVLDRDRAELDSEPTTRLPSRATPASLAYVIYTSGSTGRPKGVPIPHENVLRLLDATRGLYDFGPDDVWPLFHSYAFDVSVWELWGAFLHGGRLVIVPYVVSRSPEAFYQLSATRA
jgi:non-ribosomal peptide synthetase component F